MEEDPTNPIPLGIHRIQKKFSPNIKLEDSDDYILIHHTYGVDPYEIKKTEIIWIFDLIEKLRILETKNWMTAKIAIDLVEYHSYLNRQ